MRHKLIGAREFKALQMLNERFRVCAISGAMDGVTSELNPGWVDRRISAFPEMRYALLLSVRVRAARQHDVHVTYLAGVVFPSMSHSDSIRALRHPWLRLSRHQQGTS